MAIPYDKKEYQQGQAVTQAQQAVQDWQKNQPGQYQSQFQGQMDSLLQQYQSRQPFQYDVNADALFQQAAQRAQQQGQKAMMDTMGQASALTGGYGNSYAMGAGQQAYQAQLQGLYDNLPQYYQMAADQYDRQGQNILQQYGMMADLENQAYNRYQDSMDRYYQGLDRLQGAYENERAYDYNVFADNRDFDYGVAQDQANRDYRAERDAVADRQWDQQWAYQQQRDQVADSQWADKFQYQKDRDAVGDKQWQTQWDYATGQDSQKLAQAQVDAMLAMGADIPDELLAAAGYSREYVNAVKASAAAGGGYGGGGGSSSGSTNLSDKTGFQIASNELGAALSQARQQGGTISQQNIENYITGMYKAGVIDANEAQGLRDIWT